MRYLACLLLFVPLALVSPGAAQAGAGVDLEFQAIDGHVLLVDRALLPDGGFVVIRDQGILAGDVVGSVVGVSAYFEPGHYTGVAVPLRGLPEGEHTLTAMPHRDSDGDGSFDFVTSVGTTDPPYGGAVTDQARVTVGASLAFGDQRTVDGTVHVERVSLPEGGYLVIHDETLLEGDAVGSVVGSSGYLPPGTHEEVVVAVHGPGRLTAMLHQDTDGDTTYDFVTSDGVDDGPYLRDGTPVATQANVAQGDREAEDRGPRATPTTGDQDAAGPGLVAIGALVAAVLWIRRR